MFHGGGRLVITAGDRVCGPGHFGRTIIDEGVEIMSCHYEADFDMGGRSVLGIRPLLWKNDWPIAADRFKGGKLAILSERRGYSLEMAVDFQRIDLPRRGGWRTDPNEPIVPVADQKLEDVNASWPAGSVAVRCADYMFRPHQLWDVKPITKEQAPKGKNDEPIMGTLCGPLFTICIAGTDRAITATEGLEVITRPLDNSAEQFWRVEQLTDGTFRIMPYSIPGQDGPNQCYCLYSIADSTPTLAKYDFKSDNSKWNLRQP